MQDSSSKKCAMDVVLPLLVGSLIINVFQHSFHSSRMEMLKSASDLYEQKFKQQEEAITQLEKDKDAAEARLQGYIAGRR